jgi:pilus assembly protein CpaB
LIVTPQDAITLNYVINSGAQLTLALRSAGDDTRVQTEAVTLQFLLDQYNIPVPAKLPFGIPNREGDDIVNAPALPNDATPTPVP